MASDHGAKVRAGLRQARRDGVKLGGLRPARRDANDRLHAEALERALRFREVIEAGQHKTLAALGMDLAAAGCLNRDGKPLAPAGVKRLRDRLAEALREGEAPTS